MTNSKRQRYTLKILLAALMVLLVLYFFTTRENASQIGYVSEDIVLEGESIFETTVVRGKLKPKNQQIITSPFESQILEIHALNGQRVEEGDLLVTLDSSKLESEVRTAKIALLVSAEKALELGNWQEGQQVKDATQAVRNAERGLWRATAKLSKTVKLYERGIIPKDELDADQQALIALRDEVESAGQRLNEILNRGNDNQVRIAALELKNAEEIHIQLAELLSKSIIRSPLSGIIEFNTSQDSNQDLVTQTNDLVVGDVVEKGKVLFTINDVSEMLVRADVIESKASKFFTEQDAIVGLDAYPDISFDATITHISSKAVPDTEGSGKPTIMIEAAIISDDKDQFELLNPGGEVYLEIDVSVNENGLLLPLQALRFIDDQVFVNAELASGQYALKSVEIGSYYDGRVQVISGLEGGDKIRVTQPATAW